MRQSYDATSTLFWYTYHYLDRDYDYASGRSPDDNGGDCDGWRRDYDCSHGLRIIRFLSSAQTLTVPITLTGTAVNVDYAPQTGTFLTSVTEQSSPSLRYEIEFGANTGAEREVTLTFEALDGSSNAFGTPVTTEITITQAKGSSHTFSPTSTYNPVLVGSNLTAAGGDISIAFALGGGATGWEAVEALDYVSLTPSSGDASTPVVVTYEANETFVARDVVITITTTGATGVAISDDVSISQEGAQGITVVTDPAVVLNLSTAAGSIDVDVSLLWQRDRLECEF